MDHLEAFQASYTVLRVSFRSPGTPARLNRQECLFYLGWGAKPELVYFLQMEDNRHIVSIWNRDNRTLINNSTGYVLPLSPSQSPHPVEGQCDRS